MFVMSCLKKSGLSLFIAGLVLVFSNISGAQVFSAIPGCGNLDLGSIKVSPFVQAGYKNIGFNLNIPFTVTPFGWNGPPAHDLKFTNAGVWMGSIGFEAKLPSTLFLAARADANASKNITVISGENYPWLFQPVPYTWHSSQLQWWDIDGMLGYSFFRDWSVIAGLRYDHLTVSLSDPTDANGAPFTFPGETIVLTRDLIVKTWIPYIGLQLDGANYKAQLIYSPFASPQVTDPERFTDVGPGYREYANDQYTFNNTGSFLEGYFEYNLPVRDPFLFGLWARGTWMKVTGSGDLDSRTDYPLIPLTELVSLSKTGTLSTYAIGGGVSATLSF